MNSLITTGNNVSARIVDQLITAAWQGGLALLIAWCICALWKNSSPRVRCWLWRIAFAKLLLALVWVNPWQLPVLPPEPQEVETVASYWEMKEPAVGATVFGSNLQGNTKSDAGNTRADNWSAENQSAAAGAQSSGLGAGSMQAGQGAAAFGAIASAQPPITSAKTVPAAVPTVLSTVNWQSWLIAIWGTGVAVGLLVLCKQHLVACKLRSRAQPATADELRQLRAAITNRLTLVQSPEVRFSADVQGPMLIGFWKPIVLLPSRWQSNSKPDYLRMALTHEFAHVRRRDLLWNWLPALGRIVFWFHPLVWMTSRHWSLDVEEACDELAVNDGRLPRLGYAEFLVWIVAPRHSGIAPMTLGAASPFSHLKRRLLTMKKRSDKPRRLWVAVAGCSLLGLGVLAPVQLTAQDAPPDPGQQSQSGGATVQSGGGGTVSQKQSSNQGGATVQSGGGGTVSQRQSANQGGATVQSAGGGGGVVTQAQSSNQGGVMVRASGADEAPRASRQSGSGVVSATSAGGDGKTTVSIAKDGKSISIVVDKADDEVNVTVTRKQGESTTVNKYTLDNLDELKSKDLEAYDVFKKHTQPAGSVSGGQNVAGFGIGAASGFGGNTARFGRRSAGAGGGDVAGSGGRGGSAGASRNAAGFGRQSGAGGSGFAAGGQRGSDGAAGSTSRFGAGRGGAGGSAAGGQRAAGGTSGFGRGAAGGDGGTAGFGRGSGIGASASDGQSGGSSSSTGAGRSSTQKSGMQELLQQLMELRAKNADNPGVVKAIDDLVKQLASEPKSTSGAR